MVEPILININLKDNIVMYLAFFYVVYILHLIIVGAYIFLHMTFTR